MKLTNKEEQLTSSERLRVYMSSPFRWFGIWLINRDWRYLRLGLPAILVCCLGAIPLAMSSSVTKTDLAEMYKQQASDSLRRKENGDAVRWLQRVIQLTPYDEESTFLLGRLMIEQGDYVLGSELIRSLAPADKPGYPDAQFWVAVDLLGKGKVATESSLSALQHHLREARRSPSHAAEASGLLGDLANRTGHPEEAVEYYQEAIQGDRSWTLKLASTFGALGMPEKAKIAAEEAREYFRQVVLADPADTESRIEWSRYALAVGNDVEAENALRAGQKLAPNAAINGELSNLYVQRFDQAYLAKKSDLAAPQEPNEDFDPVEGLQFLEEALRLNPNNENAISRLPAIAQVSKELRGDVKQKFQASLDKQHATAITHLGIGVIESLDGNADEARLHFELASAQGLQSAQLMNNLAWTIAFSETPQFETALQFANQALALMPGRPEILDTRGTILAKMGRYKEAIVDLEQAIPKHPRPERARETLRQCYEAIRQIQPQNK
jgi:tetratricopeptide (TPR) repeat protein